MMSRMNETRKDERMKFLLKAEQEKDRKRDKKYLQKFKSCVANVVGLLDRAGQHTTDVAFGLMKQAAPGSILSTSKKFHDVKISKCCRDISTALLRTVDECFIMPIKPIECWLSELLLSSFIQSTPVLPLRHILLQC